ncbi:cytosolic Fe-S cluster assembly factor nubp2 isoform X1 [Mobula hypostoma]|uniref:cytosolic Fe-S cluster assembly factor nubp2 isoform X1 n=1 Tax=Mobula hypostoma TaxID=723540 RepID=UPI002FC313F5
MPEQLGLRWQCACPPPRRDVTPRVTGHAHVHGGEAGNMEAAEDNLGSVDHILLVLSGKGGVGKSTITTELALALRNAGKKVGILDIDLCGPSIPRMLNVLNSAVHQCDAGWVPVYVDTNKTMCLMSIGFLLESPDDAVIWRGPKKTALIKQFLSDVAWGELDYLIVDTPPGTSDEHISVVEALRQHKPDGALLVTTPQAVSIGDVRRELTFCKKTGLPVIGIIENMSGFVCPNCSECTNVFSRGGGEALAEQSGVPFLGCVPLDPQLAHSLEEGRDFIQAFPKSATFDAINKIVEKILSNDNEFSGHDT